MKPFFAALSFLTVVPVPAGWRGAEEDLARSVPAFPLVGALVGGLCVAAGWGALAILPPAAAAVAAVAALAAVSGALHLDGLADSADGLFGPRTRERALEIMKDSRIGAMGATALVFVLAAKIAGLASLDKSAFLQAAFLAPLAGRCALAAAISAVPYARPSGLGSVFYRRRSYLNLPWACAAAAGGGWLIAGTAGLAASGAAFVAALLASLYSIHKIGGATGDTLGATCELAETAAILAFASWRHPGLAA
ncbi:MAG: adenosylcobinamide-GDP ribazoletransferase [Planctomycetota bacterium]|nr:adenosylcobinamide-GDP ribazoletransferase [Planctomycetota bacterium]